jgi:hypothetical protein
MAFSQQYFTLVNLYKNCTSEYQSLIALSSHQLAVQNKRQHVMNCIAFQAQTRRQTANGSTHDVVNWIEAAQNYLNAKPFKHPLQIS